MSPIETDELIEILYLELLIAFIDSDGKTGLVTIYLKESNKSFVAYYRNRHVPDSFEWRESNYYRLFIRSGSYHQPWRFSESRFCFLESRLMSWLLLKKYCWRRHIFHRLFKATTIIVKWCRFLNINFIFAVKQNKKKRRWVEAYWHYNEIIPGQNHAWTLVGCKREGKFFCRKKLGYFTDVPYPMQVQTCTNKLACKRACANLHLNNKERLLFYFR